MLAGRRRVAAVVLTEGHICLLMELFPFERPRGQAQVFVFLAVTILKVNDCI